MRRALFPVLIILAAAFGLAELFGHQPGTAATQTQELPAGQQAPPLPAKAAAPAAQAQASAPQPAVARSAAGPEAASPPAAMPGMRHAAAQEVTPAGDPAAGQKVFRKCQACHSLEAGKNTIGPSLSGIIGQGGDRAGVRLFAGDEGR